ncbi:MAG: bifunctional (p)ppGpp synthetase/guanosine-3',5'-bis(diphosphate) 3'-pyrophosphohydrolase [Candidatus Harrisonbacteria bacterium]|nr:bifunctional (p)ppGpp synthetase/guanosine-3',5'-bis(diphosphate) 3'-pyrophosphohydrolase [Candidatus Harrisonbacteria bacterium]
MARLQEIYKQNNLVQRAYDFSKQAHVGQKRKNGDPYFVHCAAAAESVAEWGLDEATIAAALLHDVVEDTPHTLEEIKNQFGEDVTFLVDGVTKISKVRYRGIEAKVENLRKFILYLSQDVRVILVKLADRLHNMKTLYAVPSQKQKRIALETMEIYAPLAYRLGMQKLSGELEDLAFPYLYPQEHKWLIENIKVRFEEREKYAQRLKPMIESEFKKNDITVSRIESRAKRYTSLYKKLLRYDMNIESIYDLVALRIIVPSVEDCYAALGIIHKMWPPLPHRFKDYVALPKANGYRSLHTTVFGPENKITEIQIKTEVMHNEAENGIAAHFAYHQAKDTKGYLERVAAVADKKELGWIQQLRQWQNSFTNPEDFLNSLKIDFFQDRILTLTPKGEVIDLPDGATPVDFAYQIHTEIGNQCSGAKVNGKIVALSHSLKSGDVVEIITQKTKHPSESWLNFVRTGSAKNHIKSALRRVMTTFAKKEPQSTEIKLVVQDRSGLLNEISEMIRRSHFNIQAVNNNLPIIKITCNLTPKEKTEKLLEKLKKLKEVKEANYRLV